MTPQLKSIRIKFEQAFCNIRFAIIESQPSNEDLKTLLEDFHPDIKPLLDNCNTIKDTLSVIHDKCTLIDISCLEVIVKKLNIDGAEPYIKAYNKIIKDFCHSTLLRVCLKEKFQVEISPPPLQQEMATFVFNWNPEGINNCTLKDVLDILSQLLHHLSKHVKVIAISENNSFVTVTCTISRSGAVMLISKANQFMKEQRLTKVTISHCIIFDKSKMDEVRQKVLLSPLSYIKC